MRIMIAGLGSMGRRRARNLASMGEFTIVGVDPRLDRRHAFSTEFGWIAFSTYDEAIASFSPDVLIVSTSPEAHLHYAEMAAMGGMHCFIEASVGPLTDAQRLVAIAENSSSVMVPSCTMLFVESVQAVLDALDSGAIGQPLLLTYHVGQYLRDWHPWEQIEDFYVSHRETGGCREIVPFELTWLVKLLGDASLIACTRGTIGDLGVDIDDYYQCLLTFASGTSASLTVEVLSRPQATRHFVLAGTHGKIEFTNEEIRLDSLKGEELNFRIDVAKSDVAPGYIYPDTPYVLEMRAFLNAVQTGNSSDFPNSFEDDFKVLSLLHECESMSALSGSINGPTTKALD